MQMFTFTADVSLFILGDTSVAVTDIVQLITPAETRHLCPVKAGLRSILGRVFAQATWLILNHLCLMRSARKRAHLLILWRVIEIHT